MQCSKAINKFLNLFKKTFNLNFNFLCKKKCYKILKILIKKKIPLIFFLFSK